MNRLARILIILACILKNFADSTQKCKMKCKNEFLGCIEASKTINRFREKNNKIKQQTKLCKFLVKEVCSNPCAKKKKQTKKKKCQQYLNACKRQNIQTYQNCVDLFDLCMDRDYTQNFFKFMECKSDCRKEFVKQISQEFLQPFQLQLCLQNCDMNETVSLFDQTYLNLQDVENQKLKTCDNKVLNID